MLKAVVDASVWIQALTGGPNGLAIVESLVKEEFELCFAEPLIAELEKVLTRRKFDNIPAERKERLCSLIRERASMVTLHTIPKVSRDPKDDPYLACAAVTNAEFLVSGDSDLLILDQYQDTQIVNPRGFLQALGQRTHFLDFPRGLCHSIQNSDRSDGNAFLVFTVNCTGSSQAV